MPLARVDCLDDLDVSAVVGVAVPMSANVGCFKPGGRKTNKQPN